MYLCMCALYMWMESNISLLRLYFELTTVSHKTIAHPRQLSYRLQNYLISKRVDVFHLFVDNVYSNANVNGH